MDKDKKDYKKTGADFARYSGLAFEMMAIIGGSTWGAVWLDKQTGCDIPWFTIILSPLSVIVSLILIVRDLNKNKE